MRNKVVWKYTLAIADTQELELPYGSQYLSCACQREDIVLWFLVNPVAQLKEKWQVFIFGTGHEITEERFDTDYAHVTDVFAGTVLMMDGALVWHIWLRHIH